MSNEIIDNSVNLKEALIESLNASLSQDTTTRVYGEQHINAMEVTDDYGTNLVEIALEKGLNIGLRQLSSVLLKQYVVSHWSKNSDKFREPETPESLKTIIRQQLPSGLNESIKSVRVSIAYAIAAIAQTDWPDNWPNLFNILMEALTSGDINTVDGAMRVLSEFISDITDKQMPSVVEKLFPSLYQIFTNVRDYSVRIRTRSVIIFNTCIELLGVMSQVDKSVAINFVEPSMPQFIDAYLHALDMETDAILCDYGLKKQIIEALQIYVFHFSKETKKYIQDILTRLWKNLTDCATIYVNNYVNVDEEITAEIDSDGCSIDVKELVKTIFRIIECITDHKKFKLFIAKSLTELIYYLQIFTMITAEDIDSWTKNPDRFIEEEDDETFSYSVRITAKSLIIKLCEDFPQECTKAVNDSVLKHIEESKTLALSGDSNWWKRHEVAMLTVGIVNEFVDISNLHLERFMTDVVIIDLGQNVSPYLLGRCLWVSSKYSKFIPGNLLLKLLEATIAALSSEQPIVVRLLASRAVFHFAIDDDGKEQSIQVLKPYLSHLIMGLREVVIQLPTNETIALVFEVFTVVLQVDETVTATLEDKLSPLILAILLKNVKDFMIVSLCQDNFKILLTNKNCSEKVQSRLLPTICSVLDAETSDNIQKTSSVSSGMKAIFVDILHDLVRSVKKPLDEDVMNKAFPSCIKCAMSTDDNTILQNAGECLRAYLSEAYEQVESWKDGEDQNGIFYIVQVVIKLLDPKSSESSASFVGKLISLLLAKSGGKLGQHLDNMLRAVLLKLQQAETLTVVQSLILVFAVLITQHLQAILEFLFCVPGPMGEPALEFVLNEWCSKQHFFVGTYERKVSIMALCTLLEYAVRTNDQRLQKMTVKGERIFKEGVQTRSKTVMANEEWTEIPVLIKIYKLLINELSNTIEINQATDNDDDWVDDSDNDDKENINNFENDILEYRKDIVYNDDDDDPDVKNDPLNNINLQEYLTNYLQTLANNSCFHIFAAHHNQLELSVLSQIGIKL